MRGNRTGVTAVMSKSLSSRTDAYCFRLNKPLRLIIERRMAKHPGRWKTVHDYLKDRVIYDLERKR